MRFIDEICRKSKVLRKIRTIRRKKLAKKISTREPQIISKDAYMEEKDDVNNKDYIENIVVTKDVNCEYDIIEIEVHPKRIVCPDCGGITMEGLEFCHKCGGEIDIFL